MASLGCRAVASALLLSAGAASADPAFDQLTFHGNRQRTGWNSVESVLTPTAISGSGFGKLWDSPAFDKVVVGGATYAPHMYASPLYIDDLAITGGTYAGQRLSVVIAATSNGFVYAVNAFQVGSVPALRIVHRRRGRVDGRRGHRPQLRDAPHRQRLFRRALCRPVGERGNVGRRRRLDRAGRHRLCDDRQRSLRATRSLLGRIAARVRSHVAFEPGRDLHALEPLSAR